MQEEGSPEDRLACDFGWDRFVVAEVVSITIRFAHRAGEVAAQFHAVQKCAKNGPSGLDLFAGWMFFSIGAVGALHLVCQ